jgi:hypothetical protein
MGEGCNLSGMGVVIGAEKGHDCNLGLAAVV